MFARARRAGALHDQQAIHPTRRHLFDGLRFQFRRVVAVDHEHVETVLLRHLLTMTAGFQWDENGAADYNRWILSGVPVQYVLDRLTALDLVISVQTAVVHLGGALGKPVWVMVPAVSEWRYLLRGETLRLNRRVGVDADRRGRGRR